MKSYSSGQGAIMFDSAQSGVDEILAGIGLQRAYAATIVGTAAASNTAIAEVKNPAASGKILYFYMGDLWVATAMAVKVVVDGTTINPAGTPVPQYTIGGPSVASVGGGNQLTPSGTAFIASPSLPINTDYLLPAWFWYALNANHNIQFQGGTVNQAFTVNVRWIELSA